MIRPKFATGRSCVPSRPTQTTTRLRKTTRHRVINQKERTTNSAFAFALNIIPLHLNLCALSTRTLDISLSVPLTWPYDLQYTTTGLDMNMEVAFHCETPHHRVLRARLAGRHASRQGLTDLIRAHHHAAKRRQSSSLISGSPALKSKMAVACACLIICTFLSL